MPWLHFTKMHGNGNDFIVVDAISQSITPTKRLCSYLADRHFGIGADQLLWVEKTDVEGVDFRYRIFNADGSEVEQCGNGARAFMYFVQDKGLTDKNSIVVETLKGIITLLKTSNSVRVDMGMPCFNLSDVPFRIEYAKKYNEQQFLIDSISKIPFFVVSMGNPHAVFYTNETSLDKGQDFFKNSLLEAVAVKLQSHLAFPQGVNVGFLHKDANNQARLRVFERGVGETLACGSGACAAAVYGIYKGFLADKVTLVMQGGPVTVAWQPEKNVILEGVAQKVFDATIDVSNYV